MAILTPNFSGVGGNIQNPLTTVGNTLLQQAQQQREFDQRQEQQAADLALRKEANQRAAEQLQMQKDEVARQNAQRTALASYYQNLQSAGLPGNVSAQNQQTLSDMASKIAAESKSPEEAAAKFATYQQQVLPSMTQAYDKSGLQGKIDAYRNVAFDPSKIDPTVAASLQQGLTNPLIRQQEAELANQRALDLESLRYKNTLAAANQQSANAWNLFQKEEEFKRNNIPMYDDKGNMLLFGDVMKLPEEQRNKFKTNDQRKVLLDAAKLSAEDIYVTFGPGGYPQIADANTPGAKVLKTKDYIDMLGNKSGVFGGGYGTGGSSKGVNGNFYDTTEYGNHFFTGGQKDAANALTETSTVMANAGIPQQLQDIAQQQALTKAKEVGWFQTGVGFNRDIYNQSLVSSLTSMMNDPRYSRFFNMDKMQNAVKSITDNKTSTNANDVDMSMLTSGMNTSNVVVPAQFNTSQSNTTSVNTASYVPKRDDELLRVLRQTTTLQSDPAQRAQLAKLEEASKNFVRSTDQDKQDLKVAEDALNNQRLSADQKVQLQQRIQELKTTIANGGYSVDIPKLQAILNTPLSSLADKIEAQRQLTEWEARQK